MSVTQLERPNTDGADSSDFFKDFEAEFIPDEDAAEAIYPQPLAMGEIKTFYTLINKRVEGEYLLDLDTAFMQDIYDEVIALVSLAASVRRVVSATSTGTSRSSTDETIDHMMTLFEQGRDAVIETHGLTKNNISAKRSQMAGKIAVELAYLNGEKERPPEKQTIPRKSRSTARGHSDTVKRILSAPSSVVQEEASPDRTRTPASTDRDELGRYVQDVKRLGEPLLNAEKEVELAKRIEAGLMAEAVLSDRVDANVTASAEELEWLIDDGRKAKEQMINANLRLVFRFARPFLRHASHSFSQGDIMQEGNAGLMRAVEKFDYTKGYKFSTYASWWIRQAIQRARNDQERVVRVPNGQAELINSVNTFIKNFVSDTGVEPDDSDIMEMFELSPKKLQLLKVDMLKPISLDQPIGDESGATLQDTLGQTTTMQPEDEAGRYGQTQAIEALIIEAGLNEPEILALCHQFGLIDGVQRTHAEIATILEVSPSAAQGYSTNGLRKIRQVVEDTGMTIDLHELLAA